jgi:hypothetical protein
MVAQGAMLAQGDIAPQGDLMAQRGFGSGESGGLGI